MTLAAAADMNPTRMASSCLGKDAGWRADKGKFLGIVEFIINRELWIRAIAHRFVISEPLLGAKNP